MEKKKRKWHFYEIQTQHSLENSNTKKLKKVMNTEVQDRLRKRWGLG